MHRAQPPQRTLTFVPLRLRVRPSHRELREANQVAVSRSSEPGSWTPARLASFGATTENTACTNGGGNYLTGQQLECRGSRLTQLTTTSVTNNQGHYELGQNR